MLEYEIVCGDAPSILSQISDSSVDAVITDPPYPEIDREYGRLTEADWHALMRDVVREVRRILKPTGSAVFILQPNSERVGRMRSWLWEFMAWTSRDWNMVQDCWWWNPSTMPSVHCHRTYGLLRPSVKACVWLGADNCYRSQDSVLWSQSDAMKAVDREDRALRHFPSGFTVRRGRVGNAVDERGGVTPFNLLPISNTNSASSAGARGHGAGTPLPLAAWWTRYICPTGGLIVDPFVGSGTMGIAAIAHGCSFLGIDKFPKYVEIAKSACAEALPRADHVPEPSQRDQTS